MSSLVLRQKFNNLFEGKDAASIVGITLGIVGATCIGIAYIHLKKTNALDRTLINNNDEKTEEKKIVIHSKETIKPEIIVITGANRGIGLEMMKQYILKDYTKLVIGCCRKWNSKNENDNKKRLEIKSNKLEIIEEIDMENDDSISTLKEQIELKINNYNKKNETNLKGIDLLVLNAGIIGTPPYEDVKKRSLFDTTRQEINKTFNINVCGTLLCLKELYSLVSESKCKEIVSITSRMGSISQVIGNLDRFKLNPKTDVHSPRAIAYRISKCGLNMGISCLVGQTMQDKNNIHCLLIHPGWVQTDMGGAKGKLTVEKSVNHAIDVISMARYNLKNGSFVIPDKRTYIDW